ncbi:T9SS type A sorting domain-containing protein [Cryomorpha ignava]|uniref:T9SS type A sorting domain-containing protein n=1 Tax=Cryomorpha ignava TaxID=101383 RepID=A0A7K3WVK3_9FLAO|nr:T9SS type A sorting domain-containing protein [Cryomorpha ignava]NEN25081.1 T9SS type A sorting domain-containing protein [Cryomorpha ignava]
MSKMITTNQTLNFFSEIKKHIGASCFLMMLVMMSGTSWAQTCYNLSVGGGSYVSETSWEILDSEGAIVASGSGAIQQLEVCLSDACYTLNMEDSWGDGWNGNELIIETSDTLFAPVVVAGPFTITAPEEDFSSSDFALGEAVCETDCPIGNFGDACDDNDPTTVDDIIMENCECAGTPTVFEISCDQPLAQSFCYGNNESLTRTYSVSEGTILNLNFLSGNIEGGWDDIVIYDGDSSEDSILYSTLGVATGAGPQDLSVINVNSTGNAILLTVVSDQSVSCQSSATYEGGWQLEVSCAVSFDCPQLEANIGDACDDQNADTENDVIDANCGCAGTPIIVFDCPQLEANFGDTCDDNDEMTENDVIDEGCGCEGTPIVVEFDCPDLEANFGDACNDGNDATENDVIVEGCGCEGNPVITPSCEDFVYYISDHAAADGISDIYSVTLSGGVATMEYIATSDIEIHIAYNHVDNLIYAVSKHENSYRTLNPHVVAPTFGPTIALGADYGELTAAVFNADGKLLIGSQNNNAIYSVNVITDVVSPYDTYAPVTGGDLAFASDGMLYLATRSGNGLYEVYPADVVTDNLIGSVTTKVTGLAITDSDQLLVSNQGNSSLEVRNLDGTNPGTTYVLTLDGEPYTLRDGDMASGCNTFDQPVEGECLDYKLYYIHQAASGGSQPLLEVTLNGDGTASYTTVIPNLGGHIGLSPDGSLIYNVGGSDLKIIDVASATVIATLNITTASGTNLSGFPAAVVGSDGTVYAGRSGANQVYTIDPSTGIATPYGPSRNVNGGDLIEVNGEIWLITRSNNTFTNVLTGASFTVPVNEINGAAVLDNGNVLLADGNGGSLLKEVNLASMEVVATYDIALPLFNGDLAGGCTLSGGLNTQCYGSEILGFNQGLQTNGSAVPADRSDATAALGQPDASNAAGGFVSLGVGGSITIGFGGVIYDLPGNDILIWETSFSGDACGGSDDEQADIALSQDGINFVSVGSICRDGGVDIAGTGLDYVSAIRITNSASTGSLDGYDLDGVEAINGCSEEPAIENGDCYATEVVEYIQGVKSNGGAIAANRTDASKALDAPERVDQLVFVSLGYGGSITLAFDGAIPNGPGDDIEVVETTYGNSSCASYAEYADVHVSVDGINFFFAKTVCRANGFVDISDAGPFAYVNFVRVVNNDTLSTTPDAFDVDGVVALHNCEEEPVTPGLVTVTESELSSFPNPTAGQSQVIFITAETGRTLVEVYDMSGRNIATLFNAQAENNKEYRLDFDGAALPNGVYIYRMTTNNETIIEKFMIAK